MNTILAFMFLTGGYITGPMEFEGLGKVYRYEGKANFSWQHKEAQRMMRKHCRRGRPVVVNIGTGRQGIVRFGNTYAANRNQVIYFRCKR